MAEISVILCTHNPRPEAIRSTLDGLQRQTLAASRWELLIIDNASSPAISAMSELRLPSAARIVEEPMTGLTAARARAIRETASPLLVFVDDDNVLDVDYLEQALAIAENQPELGAFGGVTRAPADMQHLPRWKKRLLPYLGVRDYGREPIVSSRDRWGKWEPIGAGMVVRRCVADWFLKLITSEPRALELDRSGAALLSGGDSLLARGAYRCGLSCAYEPALKLTHLVAADRLTWRHLFRVLHGHGRSAVLLNRVLGLQVRWMFLFELPLRLPIRVVRDGLSGFAAWGWDIGYFSQVRKPWAARERDDAERK